MNSAPVSPLVTVVIPTYKGVSFIRDTLKTVLAQTFTDWECVVVDDGSPDETPKILEEFARTDQRFRIVRQENQGIGAARNRGIEEARGRYVALLDHDDLWMPEKLERQLKFMAEHPSCAACAVPYSYSTSPDRHVVDVDLVADARGIVRRPMLHQAEGKTFLITSGIMFDAEKAKGLRYATQRKCIEDISFQVGLYSRGDFGIAGRDILMVYRCHSTNYSSQAAFYHNGIAMLREMAKRGDLPRFPEPDRSDLRRYLAQVGRVAAVQDLMADQRLTAASCYIRELPHQLMLGRFQFIFSFPLLLMMPRAVLLKRWKATRPG